MVTFICSACGESLKKNQVDSHCSTKCRRCDMVSCVDCGIEFWGNDYSAHIKCISEEEKYSGKSYKAKPGGNKGEVKQEAWTQQVQRAVDGMQADRAVREILQQIQQCVNIPRKQAKFHNFLKNSLRIRGDNVIVRVWEAIQTEINKDSGQNNNNNNSNNNDNNNSESNKNDISNGMENSSNKQNENSKIKSKDMSEEIAVKDVDNGATHGKKGKRKREKDENKKEVKTLKTEAFNELEASSISLKTFSWTGQIKEILQNAPDHQISEKKFRKKFLKKFKANGENVSKYTDEEISAKLDRKMSKSICTLENDIVKLKEQK